jgi:hypothetical protein
LKWVASTVSFLGDGTGRLNVDATQMKSASIDLGAGFFANNPGVYDLSLDITQPTVATPAQSWIAVGFAAGTGGATWDVGQNHVGANGAPWLISRLNGQEVVFGGPGTGNQRLATAVGAVATGVAHTFTLQLDTTAAAWRLNAFLDGVQQDLNGASAGNTYTYATNPAARYLAISTGTNVTGSESVANGTIDNFVLTGPTIVPEPGMVGVVLVGLGWLAAGRRRR